VLTIPGNVVPIERGLVKGEAPNCNIFSGDGSTPTTGSPQLEDRGYKKVIPP